MNILFLTLDEIYSIQVRGIYTDLMRQFVKMGHHVSIVCPKERRRGVETYLIKEASYRILNVKTLNIQKTNIIEKGLGILAIEHQYLNAITKYLSDIRFDLVLYSTPPITLGRVIRAIKHRDGAHSYLLLKDIFPQNAVDIGLMKENGLFHLFFRRKEKKLYKLSDYIGCLSPANVDYLLHHNPEIDRAKVEVCPNSIEPVEFHKVSEEEKKVLKAKYKIPEKATIFIYGGNLGKPQGLIFMLEVLTANRHKEDRFFIIVGTGTERKKLEDWFETNRPDNALLLEGLPKNEYDQLVKSCDVGLIFLDPRFTIPNFPSRLLSYLEYKMPVLIASDNNTDIGRIAFENKFGFYSLSGDLESFNQNLDRITADNELITEMGENGLRFLEANYKVEQSVEMIIKHF